MRIALVHDYLNQAGGAEKVVEVLCEMFPTAPLYTSVYDPDAMPDFWRNVQHRLNEGEVLEVVPYHPHRVRVAGSTQ